ncbi:hypothetical protein D3C72_1636260 [compost metagenome]
MPSDCVNSGLLNMVCSTSAIMPSLCWKVAAMRATRGAGGLSPTKYWASLPLMKCAVAGLRLKRSSASSSSARPRPFTVCPRNCLSP